MNDKKTRDSMKIYLNKKIYSSELNKHILIIVKQTKIWYNIKVKINDNILSVKGVFL